MLRIDAKGLVWCKTYVTKPTADRQGNPLLVQTVYYYPQSHRDELQYCGCIHACNPYDRISELRGRDSKLRKPALGRMGVGKPKVPETVDQRVQHTRQWRGNGVEEPEQRSAAVAATATQSLPTILQLIKPQIQLLVLLQLCALLLELSELLYLNQLRPHRGGA